MPITSDDALASLARSKLVMALGEAKAQTLAEDTLRHLGLAGLSTPKDLLVFSKALIAQGGLIAMIGNSLRIAALLRGAKE